MPLNALLIGKRYEPATFTVDRERVLAFARAIGESDPIFHDVERARAAGFDDQVAPPTFPTVFQILALAQVVFDPELGMDFNRIVHSQQEYRWNRVVHVGDVLTVAPTIRSIRTLGSNEILEVEAEVTDASGDVVVVAQGSLLSRGTAGEPP